MPRNMSPAPIAGVQRMAPLVCHEWTGPDWIGAERCRRKVRGEVEAEDKATNPLYICKQNTWQREAKRLLRAWVYGVATRSRLRDSGLSGLSGLDPPTANVRLRVSEPPGT